MMVREARNESKNLTKEAKALLLLLFISTIQLGCDSKNFDQPEIRQDLIQQLINSPKTQTARYDGKIVIVKKDYCKITNCEEYFNENRDQILIYSMEDAFMRGISNYVIIERIDLEEGTMTINRRTGKKYERIILSI